MASENPGTGKSAKKVRPARPIGAAIFANPEDSAPAAERMTVVPPVAAFIDPSEAAPAAPAAAAEIAVPSAEAPAEAAMPATPSVVATLPAEAVPTPESAELIDASTPTFAAAAPSPQIAQKGSVMATTFEAPKVGVEKAQALIGDMNERAKSAFEKSSKMGEELTEFTKGNVEAIVASGKIVAKGAESLTQEAADYSKKSFESATAAFKSFASVKSPTELFQLQSEFAKTSFDSAVAEASKVSEAWLKLAGEMMQPLSSRYAVAAEKIKATTSL